MPNPLDCPREIRDMIFSMYFADVLKVGSQRCRQRDDDWGQNILTVKHAVAREAAGAALKAINAKMTTTKAQLERIKRRCGELEQQILSVAEELVSAKCKEWDRLAVRMVVRGGKVRSQEKIASQIRKWAGESQMEA